MQWLISLLSSPILGALVDAYKARLASLNAQDAQALQLGIKAIEAEIAARAEATTIIIAEQGRWWTALPRSLVQYSCAIFFAKCVVWDTVLGLGSTPALGGDIANTFGLVMAMWFGGRTAEKIASIVASRFGK